nr:glycosyltransferase family 2 protein [Schaedlerella arabinosiphila]
MISVCMAAYNGSKYIGEQIDSILNQIKKDDELIISDDGSTDETCTIIKSYKDDRIRLLHGNFHDYTRNFENALKHSKGDYIFLADQDDIWIEGKVLNCLKALENSNCNLVVTDAIITDNNLNIIENSYFEYCRVKNGFFVNLLKSRYIGACMAFHRRMLDVYLPIPGSSKYIAHDYWIACISELRGNVILLHEPLMYYRRHAGTASQGIEKRSKKGILEKLYKRIYICIYIVRRIKSL